MKIGEVAKQSGFATSTIRYYEEIGLLPKPKRISGQRAYDEGIFTYLRVIKLAQASGFSLDDIQTLFNNGEGNASAETLPSHETISAEWHTLAQQKLTEIDQIIAQYQSMRQLLQTGIDCNCLTFEACELYLAQP